MGSFLSNALMLVLIMICSCFNVLEAYHGNPAAEAPTPSPHTHYPVVAPTQPPSHHHHHSHPPTQSPSHHHPYAPAHPPSHYAPVPAPVSSSSPSQPPKPYIPRSFVEVQGVVYCKSCKYPGVDTLLDAKPLYGATINLSCKNTKYAPANRTAATDGNGYFRMAAPKNVTSYAFHRCKVYLVKSPEYNCSKASNLHGGVDGADLKPSTAFIDGQKNPVVLYNVGPLAFEPTCPR